MIDIKEVNATRNIEIETLDYDRNKEPSRESQQYRRHIYEEYREKSTRDEQYRETSSRGLY